MYYLSLRYFSQMQILIIITKHRRTANAQTRLRILAPLPESLPEPYTKYEIIQRLRSRFRSHVIKVRRHARLKGDFANMRSVQNSHELAE